MFGGIWKMTPKRPLIESKRTLFLKNRHILTPKRDLRESHLALKNNPFFPFLWSRRNHVYNTIIQVAPPGAANTPAQGSDRANWSQKVTLSSKAIGLWEGGCVSEGGLEGQDFYKIVCLSTTHVQWWKHEKQRKKIKLSCFWVVWTFSSVGQIHLASMR